MRIITIEDKAYQIKEKDFKALLEKKRQLDNEPYRHGKDVEMNDFIDSLKPSFKLLGFVEFDFRL